MIERKGSRPAGRTYVQGRESFHQDEAPLWEIQKLSFWQYLELERNIFTVRNDGTFCIILKQFIINNNTTHSLTKIGWWIQALSRDIPK